MLVKYQDIPPELRDDVRSVNDKGHAPYIVYLMLKRFPIKKIPAELLKMSLSSVDANKLQVFFRHALFPLLKSEKLDFLYKNYVINFDDEKLDIGKDFAKSNDDRLRFINKVIKPTGSSVFFSKEIKAFYRGKIPKQSDGKLIIEDYGDGWQDILSHNKRHVIDNFLIEGRKSIEIADHFKVTHNEIINVQSLKSYSEGFMNSKLHNMSKMITDVESRLENIQESIKVTRDDEDLTAGEKSVIISQLKKDEIDIRGQLKKLRSLHNSGAFATANLEYTNIRDILEDVLVRTHRRIVMMDARTDDDVVVNINRLASTVDRMAARIISVDEAASSVETRTITEEMIEVITPTLDRIESEEEEAIREYELLMGIERPKEHVEEVAEILGFD